MIEWFRCDGSGVAQHQDDEHMLLIGDVVPSRVRLPQTSPVDPGRELAVTAVQRAPCPQCQRPVRLLVLEDRWRVADCNPGGCGYVFHRLRG